MGLPWQGSRGGWRHPAAAACRLKKIVARALEVALMRLGVLSERERETAHSVDEIRSCLSGLHSDCTLAALLSREGLAAQAYWRVLSGLPLPWPEWAKKRIPSHWTRVWPRQ